MKNILALLALLTLASCGAQHAAQRSVDDEEMINIGYQTISRQVNTQSVSSIEPDQNATSGYSSLADYLRGKVAGVEIRRNRDGKLAVFIRGGANSIMLDTSALIIVDGFAVSDFEEADSSVSVMQIKRVDVLKDGGIYGARGANGVVLITTK